MSQGHTVSRKRIKLEDESDSDNDKKHVDAIQAPELQYGPIPSNEELMNRQRQQSHVGPMLAPAPMYYGAPPPLPGPMYYAAPPGPMYIPPPPMMPPPMPAYLSYEPPPPMVPSETMAAALNPDALPALVLKIAYRDPTGTARILLTSAYNSHGHAEAVAQRKTQHEVLDFDQYSKDAWHTLNTSHYTNLKSSKQYEASFDAFEEVKGMHRSDCRASACRHVFRHETECTRDIAQDW